MRKTKNKDKGNPDPYEDMIRLKQLDPYEALIKSNKFLKNNNK
tara:strand:+ start:168 stop:296 length:129 start_codon:yes stop_codon:yes gene_type:complete